ncbi:hypothetical protein BDW71DRAFT_95252 [Aspergillus fruticulosus]
MEMIRRYRRDPDWVFEMMESRLIVVFRPSLLPCLGTFYLSWFLSVFCIHRLTVNISISPTTRPTNPR